MKLADITLGETLSDKDGVKVLAGTVDGRRCVVKKFDKREHRREVKTYELLREIGVPTLEVLGSGSTWVALEHLDESRWRLATDDDLSDATVAALIGEWYATLHTHGVGHTKGLYRENDLLRPEHLDDIAHRWPELGPGVRWARAELPGWLRQLEAIPETLTYNDFYVGNLAVARDGSAALMFDYNMLGRGYPYADIRNVTVQLSDAATAAFLARYEELAGPIDPGQRALDESVAPLIALIFASRLPQTPGWAEESLAWLTARS